MQRDGTGCTVIIPTYNRGAVVERCVEALLAQSCPADSFEIIISDDGSGDDTRKRISRLASTAPERIRYIWQPNSGANAARNRAVNKASGRVLLFINDDTIAERRMVEEHLLTHRRLPAEEVSVLGRVTISPEVPESIFAKLHLDANFGLWQGRTELDWRAFYTCNVSVKRSFLLKHGLFEEDIRYHEDIELSERLSRHGLRVIYNPDALGFHLHLLSEKDYLKVAERDGTALAMWFRKSPHLRKELASIGFYPLMPMAARIRYTAADLAINRFTAAPLAAAARLLSRRNETLALMLYRKLYQSIKRKAIRHELRKKTG